MDEVSMKKEEINFMNDMMDWNKIKIIGYYNGDDWINNKSKMNNV